MLRPQAVSDVCAELRRTHRRLLCRASFEERSVVLARGLAGLQTTAFASRHLSDLASRHLDEIKLVARPSVHRLDTASPLGCAATMAKTVRSLIDGGDIDDLVIDITTFRREELLMLLAILRKVGVGADSGCKLVYVAASDMSPPLSGPVTRVRSVIGYAGASKPTCPTLLVVLMGFETQRAASIIDAYEPVQVLLGRTAEGHAINDTLFAKSERFFSELQSRSPNQIGEFTFSARDPFEVAKTLDAEIRDKANWNVVVAPLNTKLSTLGAGLYALRNPDVQVCYAPVRGYNELFYSTSADHAYVVPLSGFLDGAEAAKVDGETRVAAY